MRSPETPRWTTSATPSGTPSCAGGGRHSATFEWSRPTPASSIRSISSTWRGTFANGRIRNALAGGREGGLTVHQPSGELMTIHEASERYLSEGVPLLVIAGKEYGSGSSRDWAAKGPFLQGIRAVLAESYERIHRSNLVGMGILPLQFMPGQSAASLGLTGHELFDVEGLVAAISSGFAAGRQVRVRARAEDRGPVEFEALVRIDTPQEVLYYRHGGILQFVLRQLLGRAQQPEPLSGRLPAGAATHAPPADSQVEEGSIESFPASDPPAY